MAEIFSVRQEDYDELSLFLSFFEKEAKNRQFWLRIFGLWWDKNPAFSNDTERGWLLKDKDKIVGFIGNLPSYFQLHGKQTRVSSITTWNVLPEYRNQSIGLLFKLINLAEHSLVFDTTPTETVAKTLESLGFLPLPGYKDTSSFVIINHNVFIRSKISGRFARKIPTGLLSCATKTFQSHRIRALQKTNVENVKNIATADSSFDKLWERTKNLYLNTNVRTAEAVNWHCIPNACRKKALLGYYENKALLGYIILGEESSSGLRILKCLDLWFEPSDKDIVAALVNSAINYAVENSMDLLLFPHFSEKLRVYFRRAGLFDSRTRQKRLYFKGPPEILNKITENNSYFVELEGDRGMF